MKTTVKKMTRAETVVDILKSVVEDGDFRYEDHRLTAAQRIIYAYEHGRSSKQLEALYEEILQEFYGV